MSVYTVIIEFYQHDGSDIGGIFSTEEKALNYTPPQGSYVARIEKWRIDGEWQDYVGRVYSRG